MYCVVMLALNRIQNFPCEQQLLRVCLVIAIGVGQQKNPVRRGNNRLVAQHTDAVHAINVRILVKDCCLVGPPIAAAIFKN